MKYCFKQDCDCHWYLVPKDKEQEFDKWILSIENEKFDVDEPIGILMLGTNISIVTFENPELIK